MSNAPICEDCSIPMIDRTRRSDGKKFYGCPNWPQCDNTEIHEDEFCDAYGNTCYFDTLA
jgi:ssDNA-binding Zn-finger/Zn-ribbon topoisomerase 1